MNLNEYIFALLVGSAINYETRTLQGQIVFVAYIAIFNRIQESVDLLIKAVGLVAIFSARLIRLNSAQNKSHLQSDI